MKPVAVKRIQGDFTIQHNDEVYKAHQIMFVRDGFQGKADIRFWLTDNDTVRLRFLNTFKNWKITSNV